MSRKRPSLHLEGRDVVALRSALERLTPLVDALKPMERRQSATDAALEACRHYSGVCRRRLRGMGRDPDEIIERWLIADGKPERSEDGESFRGVGRPSVD